MKEKLYKNKTLTLIIVDLICIVLAIYISFLFRFDGHIPNAKMSLIFWATIIAILVTLPTFLIQKLYRLSGSYISLTDIPKILASVIISTSFFAMSVLIFRNQPWIDSFPRAIIFSYGILLFMFVVAVRFSKRIYWQLIKKELSSENKWKFFLKKRDPSEKERINTVLITGGAGYIGSVLARKLLQNNYRVKVIDKLLFGDQSIKDLFQNPNFLFLEGDIQNQDELKRALEDVDAVVHLAAIVGDPACAAKPDLAIKTNYLSTVNLAKICRDKGIRRFIFASTCSSYGASGNEELTESSVLNPVSLYAESKIYAEKELIKMTSEKFLPIVFRFSTVYGLSPRMRFDLVVNLLTMKAYTEKEIMIFGGNQWRPFIHVEDITNTLLVCLRTPLQKINGQIFNLGANEENYLISDISKLIKEIMPETKINILTNSLDERNYNVLFNKVKMVFNFFPTKTVKDGIIEIYNALQRGDLKNPTDSKYYNSR
ncbi:MAG: NAD-dependent epimerase/dehydratase family protein [Patescibacteria group bacterium]|nr:NAD-dependent epimerase/dehydratase family protein [Patescibacteria group bacterium]MDD5121305.1 NAD-dependent epimerase/dehydratase family protein [Patescibacteria group bacterium]MDD5221735.1 NAD-dependent epimerase/dehydratase family protein [Patescibacteria group bacterium]MDD5395776.1 NAD-dependent epimerase/dehydratase family protein [Patescibacteria group bacterium]